MEDTPDPTRDLEEKKKLQQKIVKMRKRIAGQRSNTAMIISSLGFTINQRNAPPPTLTALKTGVQKLTAMKEALNNELRAILESDAHCHCQELESDVVATYEEYHRLQSEFEKTKECEKQISEDIATAKQMLETCEMQQMEIEQMKTEIDEKLRELIKLRTSRKVENLTESALREDILKISSVISAEEMSTSHAIFMVEDCCTTLFREAESARARLSLAIRKRRELTVQ